MGCIVRRWQPQIVSCMPGRPRTTRPGSWCWPMRRGRVCHWISCRVFSRPEQMLHLRFGGAGGWRKLSTRFAWYCSTPQILLLAHSFAPSSWWEPARTNGPSINFRRILRRRGTWAMLSKLCGSMYWSTIARPRISSAPLWFIIVSHSWSLIHGDETNP